MPCEQHASLLALPSLLSSVLYITSFHSFISRHGTRNSMGCAHLVGHECNNTVTGVYGTLLGDDCSDKIYTVTKLSKALQLLAIESRVSRHKHVKHTWYFHSIHVDLLDKIHQPKSLCYLCRCYIFTLPPEISEKLGHFPPSRSAQHTINTPQGRSRRFRPVCISACFYPIFTNCLIIIPLLCF